MLIRESCASRKFDVKPARNNDNANKKIFQLNFCKLILHGGW